MELINATGRRKSAVARVYLKEKGSGQVLVNKKDYKIYFPQIHLVGKITEAIEAVEGEGKYDFTINVYGGGPKGQAEAIRLGIARTLVKLNEEFKTVLKSKGFLSRDPRTVERKKYGFMKARKQTQYRKR